MTATEDANKALLIEAFDTLFNRRDYSGAETLWSPDYIQHSANIAPGRTGLFTEQLPVKDDKLTRKIPLNLFVPVGYTGEKPFGGAMFKIRIPLSDRAHSMHAAK